MLKRLHVKGYKSLVDVELSLEPLTLLIGPNASGKSNLLDALQLLAGMATGRTLKQAFDPPCRGKPLESFHIGQQGIRGLLERDRLTFSIEADLQISDALAETVDRQIREMRRRPQDDGSKDTARRVAGVRERNLRYRVEVEMLPRTGILRVADEYLWLRSTAAANRPASASRSSSVTAAAAFICAMKGRRIRPTTISISITRFSLSRTIRRIIPT